MRRRASRLLFAATVFVLIPCLLAGCGGGGGGSTDGGGGGAEPPPPPPPPPPPVEIGPGPGPAADAIPTEPAISTVAARGTPFATAPHRDLVRQAAIDRIDQFADDPPDTEAELQAVLADFTGWVIQEPNDVVSQAGLAAAVVLAGAYNAGIDAGYTSDQILGLLSPVTEIASAGLGERSPQGRDRLMSPAADFPDPTDPDFSSADLQIGIRKFLLPALHHARARLEAVANNAPGPGIRLAEFHTRHGSYFAYRAEFRALSGVLRVAQSVLLQFCAYQFNPGDWDWTASLAGRDADGDGLLLVDEYLPGDPFLWRHDSNNMQLAGRHMRGGLAMLVEAFEATYDDSLLTQTAGQDGPLTTLAKLRDLQQMAEGEVQVQIVYEGGTDGSGSISTRMNLRALWDTPVDDLKALFPKLVPVSGSYWEALPRAPWDFPRRELGGLFPEPDPVLRMLSTGPTYIAVSHGSVERLTVIDRRDGQ